MGCSVSRSQLEIKLTEIWDESVICLMSTETYLKLIEEIINDTNEKIGMTIYKKDVMKVIFTGIITRVLISRSDDILFNKIRFHLMKDDKRRNHGYFYIFSLVFMLKSNFENKIKALNHLFFMLKSRLNKKIDINNNNSFAKSIIISYIDLVSFITMGYFVSLNQDESLDYLKRLDQISKSFRLENRIRLCEQLFANWKDNQFFKLDEFLIENKLLLDHSVIRDKLIDIDYGKEGLFIQEQNSKNLNEIVNEEYKQLEDNNKNKL